MRHAQPEATMRTLLLLPLALFAACDVEDPALSDFDADLAARTLDRDVRDGEVIDRCVRDTRRDDLACYDLADRCLDLGLTAETTRDVLQECLRVAAANDCEPERDDRE
jgi:hypothetical protein